MTLFIDIVLCLCHLSPLVDLIVETFTNITPNLL